MTATPTPQTTALADITTARTKAAELQDRLTDQHAYIGHTIRQARAAGATWKQIAAAAGMSDAGAIQASRRPQTT